MDTTGSIRSSSKHGTSGFRPTPIQPALLATAKQFLESSLRTSQGFLDTRIRQHLVPEKMEDILGSATYYVLPNEQKFEPGFLCIMKGHPIVFLQSRLQYGFTLRLRLHPSLFQQGALFIGTLDTVEATLRLEDVWHFQGNSLLRDPFSKRFELLHHFFKDLFVQDSKLSNCNVVPVDLSPLSDLKSIVESQNYNSVDLIGDLPGRKRFHLNLLALQHKEKAKSASVKTQTPNKPVVKQTETETEQEKQTGKETNARAMKIANLPDTYDLLNAKGKTLGRAAVQAAALSMKLRDAFKQQSEVQVAIEWNEEFQRYKILHILS